MVAKRILGGSGSRIAALLVLGVLSSPLVKAEGFRAVPRKSATSAIQGVSAQKEDAKAKGVIKGTVQKNGRVLKQSQIRVEIVGLGEKFRKKINSDGTFEFADVPEGTYVLKSSGSFKNSAVAGEVKDVKPATGDEIEPIVVNVE